MMKPTQDLRRDHLTEPFDRSMGWRILVQRQMRSRFVVIGSIGFEDAAQMVFASDHHVVQALATD